MRSLILLAIAGTAYAEPPRYIAASGVFSEAFYGHVGASVEGGMRFGDSAAFAHLSIGGGTSGSGMADSGTFFLVRGGFDARSCTTQFCGFVGIDLGIEDDNLDKSSGSTSAVVIPRIGFDVGGAVRARVTIEAPYCRGEWGRGASLGMAYRF